MYLTLFSNEAAYFLVLLTRQYTWTKIAITNGNNTNKHNSKNVLDFTNNKSKFNRE